MTDTSREAVERLAKRLDGAQCTSGCGTMKCCVCAYAADCVDAMRALSAALDEAEADLTDVAQKGTRAITALEARVKQMEGLLREAREDLGAYVDADYPEGSRAKYPEIRRRWNRDMDLCRRIDEALNTGDDNG